MLRCSISVFRHAFLFAEFQLPAEQLDTLMLAPLRRPSVAFSCVRSFQDLSFLGDSDCDLKDGTKQKPDNMMSNPIFLWCFFQKSAFQQFCAKHLFCTSTWVRHCQTSGCRCSSTTVGLAPLWAGPTGSQWQPGAGLGGGGSFSTSAPQEAGGCLLDEMGFVGWDLMRFLDLGQIFDFDRCLWGGRSAKQRCLFFGRAPISSYELHSQKDQHGNKTRPWVHSNRPEVLHAERLSWAKETKGGASWSWFLKVDAVPNSWSTWTWCNIW